MNAASPSSAIWVMAAPKSRNRPALLALAPLLLLALFVYGRRLGERSLSIDELYHVYASDSFNRMGTFSLPSGQLYERALPYTRMVSLSFKYLGVSEFSAR